MEISSKRKRSGDVFLRTAIAAVIASTFSSGAALAQDEKDATKLDTIEVTGSRLKRADVEGALPVTTITRADIDASGLQTAADFLRSQTFNSFGSYQSQSGDSFSSNSQISLRGLGAERTLVLIDGRRVPPSPVTGAAGVDLNTIPMAAVERIEILRDGASAIYGSDAIGGVVNIILKKDLNNTIISAETGHPTRKGGDENSAYLLSGKSTNDGNMLFGISWSSRKHIALADRSYSSFNPGDGVNYSTIRGANYVGNTLYGLSTYTYHAASSCAPDRVYTNDLGNGDVCIYPYANVAWDLTDLSQTSLFVDGSQNVSDTTSVFYRASYSRVSSAGRFAPVADGVVLAPGAAANELNEYALLLHRYEQLGPRNNFDTNTVLDVLVGTKFDVFGNPFEFGIRQSRYNSSDIGRNYTNRNIATQYLTDGTYNPYDPTKNTPDVLAKMKLTIGRDGFFKYQEAYLNASFTPAQLPAGAMQLAVGAEVRRNDYSDIYDAASEAGIVGGSAGNSAAGKRHARAGYAELLVPILSNLELDGALRYDHYSDFGDASTGKVSLRYQPIDMLTLRASVGTGFRAPSLSELYGAVANDAPQIYDYTKCRAQGISDANCPQTQVNTGVDQNGNLLGGFQGSNPDLSPEKSTQYSAGFAVNPTNWIDASLDYYKIHLNDAIQAISYQELITREANGEALPSGTAINRGPTQNGIPGKINQIITGPANVAVVDTSGLDLNVGTHFDLAGGRLNQNLQVSYVLKYVDSLNNSGQDQVNDAGVPQYRAALSNNYRVGQFALNYNVNYIDSTSQYTAPDGNGNQVQHGKVSSYTTHDVQAVWYSPFNSELTVGVRNLFDRGPSTNFTLDNPYYDNTLYDPFGRVPYVSFKQTF